MPRDYISDRIALQDLMLNYAIGVDERDFERYEACFTEDVEVVGFGEAIFYGRDDWVAYVREALQKYSSSQHLLGPQFAEIDGDSARTRCDVQALHFLTDTQERITLWATYKTDMRHSDGRWKICRHELVVRGTGTD